MSKGAYVLLFGILAACLIVAAVATRKQRNRPLPSALATPNRISIDKSKAMQERRDKLIREMMRQGVVSKIDTPAKHTHVWVRPVFHTLDFDDKRRFMDVIYSYYCDGTDGDMIVIRDSLTDERIGSYSISGLDLD